MPQQIYQIRYMSFSNVFKKHCAYAIVLITATLYSTKSSAQAFESSNLPIVIINTDINPYTGQYNEIVDDPKVNATMKIIWRQNNERNFLTDVNSPEYLN